MESYVLFTDEDLKNDQFQNRSNKQKISNDNTSVVKSNQSENLVTDDCFSDFESLKSMNIKVLSDNERKLFELLTEKMDIRIIQNDYPSVYEMLCEKIPVITSLSYKNEYMYAYICYLISYGLFYDIMKYKITSVDRFVSYFVYKKNIDNHFAAFVFEHMRYMSSVKNNYPSIYNYVMKKCPIPKDFDSTIKVHKAMYVYMLLHNMTEFPKSQISGRYVNFDKKRNRFSVFADKEEKYSEEGNRLWHEHYVQGCLEKFGVENAFQSEECKQKSRETCKERYGTEYYAQTDEYKEQYEQTCMEKYGVRNISQLDEIKQKKIETCTEHYGVEYASQSEEVKQKMRETNIERYGFENAAQSEEVRKKIYDTFMNNYGGYPQQNEEIKLKTRKTFLERYGTVSPMNQQTIDKIHESKKKNGSYGKSKEEDRLFEELSNIFDANDVLRQYKDDRYPFRCDFYIKSLDLFIEYNGYWVHNTHFYNCDSDDDQQIYNDWLNKLNEGHKAYKNALRVWTVTDPLKLQTAISNNINYIVLWTPDDIDNFLDKIKDIISVQQLCEDFQCF